MYDAVISATSSPHIVLEKSRAKNAIKTCKKRVFIDLAVPRDIEIFEDEYTVYKNIDDLTEIADNNNRIKQQEIMKAEKILQKYIDEFRIWKLFSESETLFKSAENKIENESEKNTFRHKIYNLKSDNNYAKFSEFIILLREKLREYNKNRSRKSQLAIKQTEAVIKKLKEHFPNDTLKLPAFQQRVTVSLISRSKVSAEKVFL